MTDAVRAREISERCSCGASVLIGAVDADAKAYVRDWRTEHRHDGTSDEGRSGVGFASTQASSVPRQPWGHNNQEIRA